MSITARNVEKSSKNVCHSPSQMRSLFVLSAKAKRRTRNSLCSVRQGCLAVMAAVAPVARAVPAAHAAVDELDWWGGIES